MINYVVVDEKKRAEFEKENHLPYGFVNCKIFNGENRKEEAINELLKIPLPHNFIIEKWEGGEKISTLQLYTKALL